MSAKAKIITLTVVFLLAAGFFAYGVFTGEESIKDNLPRIILTALSYIAVITRIAQGNDNKGRRSLAFFEKTYKAEIGEAFREDKKKKKKLLEAIRFYNEDKYDKALKLLEELMYETYSRDDRLAVGLFTGLCYTDMGEGEKAYEIYRPFVDTREATDTIYINCGYLMQTHFKDEEKALYFYEKAAQMNTKNDVACNNIADMYFTKGNFAKTIEYAKQALEINPERAEAAALLAITYACMGSKVNSDKYFHVAVGAGEDKEALKKAIAHYTA